MSRMKMINLDNCRNFTHDQKNLLRKIAEELGEDFDGVRYKEKIKEPEEEEEKVEKKKRKLMI